MSKIALLKTKSFQFAFIFALVVGIGATFASPTIKGVLSATPSRSIRTRCLLEKLAVQGKKYRGRITQPDSKETTTKKGML